MNQPLEKSTFIKKEFVPVFLFGSIGGIFSYLFSVYLETIRFPHLHWAWNILLCFLLGGIAGFLGTYVFPKRRVEGLKDLFSWALAYGMFWPYVLTGVQGAFEKAVEVRAIQQVVQQVDKTKQVVDRLVTTKKLDESSLLLVESFAQISHLTDSKLKQELLMKTKAALDRLAPLAETSPELYIKTNLQLANVAQESLHDTELAKQIVDQLVNQKLFDSTSDPSNLYGLFSQPVDITKNSDLYFYIQLKGIEAYSNALKQERLFTSSGTIIRPLSFGKLLKDIKQIKNEYQLYKSEKITALNLDNVLARVETAVSP